MSHCTNAILNSTCQWFIINKNLVRLICDRCFVPYSLIWQFTMLWTTMLVTAFKSWKMLSKVRWEKYSHFTAWNIKKLPQYSKKPSTKLIIVGFLMAFYFHLALSVMWCIRGNASQGQASFTFISDFVKSLSELLQVDDCTSLHLFTHFRRARKWSKVFIKVLMQLLTDLR